MRIIVLDGYTLNPGDISWQPLQELGELVVYDRSSREQTIERIGNAEAILTNKTIIDRTIIEACPELKYIGVLATGYNVVDIEAATAADITVTNIPAYSTAAVAQFTIGLLLELCHQIGDHSLSVHQGEWTNSTDFSYRLHPLIELAGKTIGLIGFGRIGRAVAPIAKALGMHVIVNTRTQPTQDRKDDFCREIEFVNLDELLARSDVISLHCPLTPQTDKIINEKTITMAKDGFLLINTGRGQLIDEQALARALTTAKAGGAALDVLATEPPAADNPLLTAPNCIITPHIAWAPKQTRERLMSIAAGNLAAWLAEEAINTVN